MYSLKLRWCAVPAAERFASASVHYLRICCILSTVITEGNNPSYLAWAWQMKDGARDGLTRQQFARYYLMRLGIGKDLLRIAINSKYPRRLASEAEVLALRPELTQLE